MDAYDLLVQRYQQGEPVKHIMLDLETLGTKPGCVILSIGAVAFDPDAPGDGLGLEFHAVIRVSDSQQFGLEVEADTLAWWLQQSAEAKPTLTAALGQDALFLGNALGDFTAWVRDLCDGDTSRVCVWGNGANFDQPILKAAYDTLRLPAPWKFWNDRCYRTLKALYPQVPFERGGVHHNALDDARSQARHAVAILRHIRAQG